MNIKITLLAFLFSFATTILGQKEYDLKSPNSKLKVIITLGDTIQYRVWHENDLLLEKSKMAILSQGNIDLGVNSQIKKIARKSVDNKILTPVYKRSSIEDKYNEMILQFSDKFSIEFRAYNDGIAYRFVSNRTKDFIVKDEVVEYNFPTDGKAFVPYVRNQGRIEDQYFNSFENTYDYIQLSDWNKERIAFSPIVVEAINGKKVAIAESDLLNYPGMFIQNGEGGKQLKGHFAPYPKSIEHGGYNKHQGVVTAREEYIAKVNGNTSFPWRVFIVAESDKELADSDMIYKLATPSVKQDFSWVKPGKVAWDWWNWWNIYGVDFEAGVNNDTYKYYIDFASQKGIEYVILDEGWAAYLQSDLFKVIDEIDLKELISYASERNVGLILWAGYYPFNRDMEQVCKHYSELGIKGFKVDFMDRDDQLMVDFHQRAAAMTAKYKLLINFHGTYKPTGLQRTYPNVINFEAVHGLENLKGGSADQVTYDVTMPFVRMIAGPIDYTQGAMRNATRDNHRGINSEAMSLGTRTRQLAEYVIFESPMNMLCDSPSNYLREEECTEFIANIPTVWDETISLDGKIGEYIAIARQSGDDWYVGALTNWDKREMKLDLSFLPDGDYQAIVFKDGTNAHRVARDYKREIISIPTNRLINLSMSSGGGYAMHIYKVK